MPHTDLLIVGAGPTGLGAAWRLDARGERNWLVVDAAPEAGGLAGSVIDECGFTWDFGGHVQFSHYEYFDALMDELLGDEGWCHHDRESWVHIKGRFVPYPFQLNLRHLPEDDIQLAVRGLIHAARTSSTPRNFGEWIDATFGRGLSELFMRPYNTKVWAREPERLSWHWIGERVAVADLARIVENVRVNRDDVSWGPNNRFRFPKHGGTGAVWRALRRRLDARHRSRILMNHKLTRLETASRRAVFANGAEIQYRRLVSTMAVDELVALSDLDRQLGSDARRLEYSSTHVIGIGLRGQAPTSLAGKCWLYFPEPAVPFYRVTHFSHYSPYNVPEPGRQWSLMAEIAESPWRPLQRADVVAHTQEGLVTCGLIESRSQVVNTWHRRLERGYPTPSIDRDDVLNTLLPTLEHHGVYSRGRFGAWKYEVSNQDHSFAQGVEVIEHLLDGDFEQTLRTPDAVNSRERRVAAPALR